MARETPTQKAARLEKELQDLRSTVEDLWRDYEPDFDGDKKDVAANLRKHGVIVGLGDVTFTVSFDIPNADPEMFEMNGLGLGVVTPKMQEKINVWARELGTGVRNEDWKVEF